ncbi:hypothetical protein J4229_00575 [Candidatus Pacearchaeota archaeon]|nr:hypothetical protein [Candidatus Pacearchaeota archaeon]
MQVNLLKNVVSAIAGEHAAKMVDFLYEKKNVNEFLIAKKLKLTINQTRNILYKLADEGVVGFVRKKDKKKGGWYTYFWTMNTGKGLLKLKEKILAKVGNLKNQLNLKKTERFYHCSNCNIESNEETALFYNYLCPECGEVLQIKDKEKEIEHIEKEIAKMEEVLASVEGELGIVGKKEEAVKARKMRAEVKQKAKERAIKKKKKEREMRKLKKKKRKIKKGRTRKINKFGKRLKKLFGR